MMLGSVESEHPRLIGDEIIFEYSNLHDLNMSMSPTDATAILRSV